MRLLDKYVLTKFLIPFIYCVFGFIAIWLVFDLSDNGPDFIEGGVPVWTVIEFYSTQIPEIIVISLPVGALLALLYSLTQMSRSNELVAMLTAGVGLVRIVVPLMFVGLALTAISFYFNYEQAPHAQAIKKEMLEDIKRGKKKEEGLDNHLYRNRAKLRIWYADKLYIDSSRMKDVQVLQQDEQGNIVEKLYGKNVYFDHDGNGLWWFEGARRVTLDVEGNVIEDKIEDRVYIDDFDETPLRIASSALDADFLGVPELVDYLDYNSDFPERRLAPYKTQLYYRYALPWVNLLAVFIAAPLGIVYSRRGILGGVATAIALFFLLVFTSSLFIAFGKGGQVSPLVAAWGPMVIFGAIALFLLWMKATNRDLSKLRIPGLS